MLGLNQEKALAGAFNLREGFFPALFDTADRPVLEVECAAVARPDQLRVGGERAAVRAAAAHREPLARLCRVDNRISRPRL